MENFIIVFIVTGLFTIAVCEYKASKCYGNHYMNTDCKGSGVIAIKHLYYGSKSYISEDCPLRMGENRNGTCCEYEDGDCLKNITDYENRYKYLSSMSGLGGISENVATPWDNLKCGNRTNSNFVQITYDCIKESKLINFCTYQKLVSTDETIHLYRNAGVSIPNTCECKIQTVNSGSTMTVSAVDVRLQPNHVYDRNLTGHCPENSTINLTFTEEAKSSSVECNNDTIFAEYTSLYFSTGSVLNFSYSEGNEDPQKVWILVAASSGKLKLECNPQLSTTTTMTTTTTTMSSTRSTTRNPVKPRPVDHGSDETGPSAQAKKRAVQNTVLYAVIGSAGLAAILIIMAGVYIRRLRRSREQTRKLTAMLRRTDSSSVTMETLPRDNPGMNWDSTDHMY